MEIIRDNSKIKHKTVVALGNFDGLHKAHMRVIENCISYAEKNGCKSGVLLFSAHTLNTINKSRAKLITDEAQKLEILEKSGIDFVYIRDFDDSFMHFTPAQFADELKEKLNPQAVCVGFDYKFGYKAAGDVDLLKELGRERGFSVSVTDKVTVCETTVKSTEIRKLIGNGDIKEANALLGRRFSVGGNVMHGLRNGTKMGIPTANIGYDNDIILPPNGVYCGYTIVCGKQYKSVINIGNNPTFDADKITVEAHLLDFNGDIYGQMARVEFVGKIRNDKKFAGVDLLKAQILDDIKLARNILQEN